MVGVETAFTRKTNGNVHLRSDRPFLVISSTSWTGQIYVIDDLDIAKCVYRILCICRR